MFQYQPPAISQPRFLVAAKILDFVPTVTIGDDTGDGHGDDVEEIMPHLRLLAGIRYAAEAFLHHVVHLSGGFDMAGRKSFWS